MEHCCKVWPGPCRFKIKRCVIISILFALALTIFMVHIYLADKNSDINADWRNFPEASNDEKITPTRRTPLHPGSFEIHDDSLSTRQGIRRQVITVEADIFVQSITDDKMEDFLGDMYQISELAREMPLTTKSALPTSQSTSCQDCTKPTQAEDKYILKLPNHWKEVKLYNFKSANFVNVTEMCHKESYNPTTKHLLLLGHYEQLGKTSINYMLAAKLAFLTNRKIVKPYVGDSRFCGLPSGWTGSLRSGTRAFRPLSLYYNLTVLKHIFKGSQLANIECLETFKDSCSFKKTGRRLVIIYFMYPNYSSKYLMLTSKESEKIKDLLNRSKGWIDCSFINKRINISGRIGNDMKPGKQYCVDPERLTDVYALEKNVLKNSPCVVFHQWRGIGFERTHFNLTVTPPPEKLLMMLQPSDYIISEVMRTLKKVGPNFVGVHIRSERQLLWYGMDKWVRCMDLVYHEVKKVTKSKNIKIFISSDTGKFGSDQIPSNFNQTQLDIINNKYNWLVKKLKAVTYSVVRPRHHIWKDRGLVGLVQANILCLASNLVTLGAGTFQKWITDKFKARKAMLNDRSWTITKVCFSELKSWQWLKSSKRTIKN